MLQRVTIGRYLDRPSLIHALDPRTKILALLCFMVAILVVESLAGALCLIALLICIGVLSRLPFRAVFGNLLSFWWFLLLTLLLHLFLTPGHPILGIYRLGLAGTHEGLLEGIVYCLRLVDFLTFAALLTLTTPPMPLTDGLERLFSPMERLRVPVRDLSMMTAIALRFVPTLAEEAESLRRAQKARGAKFGGSLVERIRALVPILIPLFVRSFQRAEELAVAMEARGFVAGNRRSTLHPLHWGWRDNLALLCAVCLTVGTVLLEKGWLA